MWQCSLGQVPLSPLPGILVPVFITKVALDVKTVLGSLYVSGKVTAQGRSISLCLRSLEPGIQSVIMSGDLGRSLWLWHLPCLVMPYFLHKTLLKYLPGFQILKIPSKSSSPTGYTHLVLPASQYNFYWGMATVTCWSAIWSERWMTGWDQGLWATHTEHSVFPSQRY